MAIAFFDLDKTLFPRNTARMWVSAEVRLGFLSRWQALRALGWMVRYHLGAADVSDALRLSFANYEGIPEVELRDRSDSFFDAEMSGGFRPGGLDAVSAHRKAGDELVLLTSTSSYLSKKTSDELQLHAYLCNRFVVDDDGKFTGEPFEPLCYGPGKVTHAERHAGKNGVALADCAYYGDSYSDVPILEAVGRPIVVNPDPRLRRLAKKRGWKMVDWDEPKAQPKR
ncbi:MAG: HAD family phosphatase [Myxococcota bacterium]